MKPVIRTPYFEVGTKNYVYGDKLLEYARAADAAAEKYDIDVLFICPALEVRRVAETRSTCSCWRRIWIRSAPAAAARISCRRA